MSIENERRLSLMGMGDVIVRDDITSSSEEKRSNSKRKKQEQIEKLIKSADSRVKLVDRGKDEKISPVWKSFQFIYIDGVRQEYVLCLGCRKTMRHLTMHGTNGLRKHIKSCSRSIQSSNGVQSTITKHFPNQIDGGTNPSYIPKKFFGQMVNACAEFCALDGRAFESINGIGFQRMIQVVFDAGRACGSKQSPIDAKDLIPSSITV